MTEVTRAEATARLIGYQDRLDAALARNRNEYEALFRGSPAGMGLHEIDRRKRIVRVNAEELRLLGFEEREMVGRLASEFVVMSEVSQRAMDKKLSAGAELKPFVRALRRADGSAVTMALVDRHLRNAAGAIVGIRTALMEIDTTGAAT